MKLNYKNAEEKMLRDRIRLARNMEARPVSRLKELTRSRLGSGELNSIRIRGFGGGWGGY
jgi:hypothetical protein